MNGLNRIATAVLDVLLTPFEVIGPRTALVVVSGLFGIVALLIFKQISWQKGIKSSKDKIKGDMIAIRIYQDDLAVVGASVGKICLRNFQYLGLNFGPILPLFIPFTLVAAQFVVRYGFEPLPVVELGGQAAEDVVMAGQGCAVEVAFKSGHEADAGKLEVRLPEGLVAVSPLVRNSSRGLAFLEVVAIQPLSGQIDFLVDGQVVGTKDIVAGEDAPRLMQPEKVSSFFAAWLWPAENTFASDSAIDHVKLTYPESDLGWLPGGPMGILIVFFVSSVVFGIAILKPLNIQI